jgi:ATP synthase protein I
MKTAGSHSGDLSQPATAEPAHRTPVTPARTPAPDADTASPAARGGKRFYNVLSASSVGLEMGLSVVIAVLIGMWLDSRLGTTPWLMLLWLLFGLAAGFRGVLRAVRRADREVPGG